MRRLKAEAAYVRALLVLVGYWIRPYDMVRDGRRWRWEKPWYWRMSPGHREYVADLQARLIATRMASPVAGPPVSPSYAGHVCDTPKIGLLGDEWICSCDRAWRVMDCTLYVDGVDVPRALQWVPVPLLEVLLRQPPPVQVAVPEPPPDRSWLTTEKIREQGRLNHTFGTRRRGW